MHQSILKELEEIRNGRKKSLSEEGALAVLTAGSEDIPDIFAAASAIRQCRFGNRISLCSILNAKNGDCGEDCAFCAQSVRHETETSSFALLSEPEMESAFNATGNLPIDHFGIVTSGGSLSGDDLERIAGVISRLKREHTDWCASLGCLSKEALKRLQAAGLQRFHHNLETAESFFPEICTTHTYATRLQTVRAAKEIGLEVCCGGILGLSESLEQRVEFAFTLRREKVDAIPLNFLQPIKGTRLGDLPPMKPWEILKSIAMFRLVNPEAAIKVCAGRLLLRDLQSMIFQAGATGMMIGDLLTIAGRNVNEDLQMLDDLEMGYAQ
ncbi:MAG: biotin synthase BioB [Verrucomicrobiota bacterium]